MIVQNWWSPSMQGASPLQGGWSQFVSSLFSGLAMLYIYIISIGCYRSIACHNRRIFVQCLSPKAYICPMSVTNYRRIFVQCLSLSAHICPMPVQNHRTRYSSICFSMIWNSSPNPPGLGEVSHLLQCGTSSTGAGSQDDVSSNKLPRIMIFRRSKPSKQAPLRPYHL